MGRFVSFAWIALVLTALTTSAVAEKRVALVIGNGAYQHSSRLPNPKNDAEDVAAALKRLGFETILGLDLDKAKMDDAAIRFNRVARGADVAIFYYSGHAMQHGGINYLMPVDARLSDEADLRRLVRVDEIVTDLQQARNLRILVLDACRDNPLAEELKRSIGVTRAASIARGIARMDSPLGMILAYATQAGRTADDGKGRNSPYTTAFLKHIEAQEEIGTVFRRVSADVFAATSQTQLPELSLSVIGEFFLKGRPPAATVTAPVAPVPPVDPDAAARRDFEFAERQNSKEVWEEFLRKHPAGIHAAAARQRLAQLARPAAPVAPALPKAAAPVVAPPAAPPVLPKAPTAPVVAPTVAPAPPPTAPSTAAIKVPTDPVAKAAFEVLDKHCARCHQVGKLITRVRPAKNFGNILQLEELAQIPALIVPGNPFASKLFKQIADQEMPYDVIFEGASHPLPSQAELKVLETWIRSLGTGGKRG